MWTSCPLPALRLSDDSGSDTEGSCSTASNPTAELAVSRSAGAACEVLSQNRGERIACQRIREPEIADQIERGEWDLRWAAELVEDDGERLDAEEKLEREAARPAWSVERNRVDVGNQSNEMCQDQTGAQQASQKLSLIHISEPTRPRLI
eukprot:2981924-Rhodomonas_salina.3